MVISGADNSVLFGHVTMLEFLKGLIRSGLLMQTPN
jgi:hypothetical protein